MSDFTTRLQDAKAQLMTEENRQRAHALCGRVLRAFTEHPREAGETYWEHFLFTLTMTGRLLYAASALALHGIFPFLCTRTASLQMNKIYAIMRARVPATGSEPVELDWQI